MEFISNKLATLGHPVQFVAINKDDAVDYQSKLVDACTFALLQDTTELGVWGQFEGGKDDFYVYDRTGKLAVVMPMSGSIDVDLGKPLGTDNLAGVALAVSLTETAQ